MLKTITLGPTAQFQELSSIREFDLKIDLEVDGEDIELVLSNDSSVVWDARSTTASLIEVPGNQYTIRVPKKNPYKLVHEIVALGISKDKTDVKLRTLKSAPYNPEEVKYLNMSPDFIVNSEMGLRIFELGTKNVRSVDALSLAFRSKKVDLMDKLSKAKITAATGTIIVSPIGVFSNCIFSQEQVDYLVSLFFLGLRLFTKACFEYSLRGEEEEDDLQAKKKWFELFMLDYPLPYVGGDLIITREMVDHWDRVISSLDLSRVTQAILKRVISDCKEDHKLSPERMENLHSQYISLMERVNSRGSRIKTSKFFKIPFSLDLVFDNSEGIKNIDYSEGDYSELFRSGFNSGIQEDESKMEKRWEEGESFEWKPTNKRLYGKVTVPLNPTQEINFAKLGLGGKLKKFEGFMKEERAQSKLEISLESSTECINSFLDLHEQLFLESKGEDRFSDFELLKTKAAEIAGSKLMDECIRIESNFSKLYISRYLQEMSLISQELNLHIQKKVTKDQFILTRIGKTRWYVMSKPTGSHLFYSLLYDSSNVKRPVWHEAFDQPAYQSDKISIFPFRSTDRDRINIGLKYYEDFCASYFDIWSKYSYEADPKTIMMTRQKALFTSMIMFDNKQVTADAIYLWRETLMKVSSGDLTSQPGLLFEKMPEVRSGLSVWFIQRMFKSLKMMIERPPLRIHWNLEEENEEDENVFGRSTDRFTNLIDIITLQAEEKFEICMYVSYQACYHSYATMSKMAADLKVIEKIVEYEIKLRDARREHMGYESSYDKLRDHEFNLEISLLGGKMKRKQLKDIFQDQTDNYIYKMLFDALRQTYLEFATFKASLSRYDYYQYDEKRYKKNVKVIEEVRKQILIASNTTASPYDDLKELLLDLILPIEAKIDKKMDQAKGLREILTMDLKSREMLRIIEYVMEMLNVYSPSEILSKGSQKEKTLMDMEKFIASIREDGYDVIVIDQTIDHSKWCQLFVMTKFASHLKEILPEPIFRLFCLILNRITEKRIILNDSVVKEFMKEHDYFSESLTELKKQFRGESEHSDLLDKFSIGLKNRSNMGQGWLHNTSSSDGDADMMIVTAVCTMFISSLVKRGMLPQDTKFFNLRIGSSDDQYQRKVLKIRSSCTDKVKTILRVLGKVPQTVSSLSCKKMGVHKSEMYHMEDIGEFNQIFRSGNTMFVGTSKFDKAGTEIPVTLNMPDRFTNFANTRRNLPENGVDIQTTGVIQILQSKMHYRSLGLGISNKFADFSSMLIKKPHPILGFFLYEPIELIGMFGQEIAMYLACRKERAVSAISHQLLKSVNVAMGINGTVGPKIDLRVTRSDRHKAFKKSFNVNEEFFNLNPECLYRRPESREEMINLIEAKGSLSNTELAFVYDTTSKMMAASPMILTEPILKFEIEKEGKRNFISTNWLGLYEFLDSSTPLSDQEISCLFPDCTLFEECISLTTFNEQPVYIRSGDLCRRRSNYHFSTILSELEIPLIECVKSIWFGHNAKHNGTLVRDSFEMYKLMYPWLKDTHEATLSGSIILFKSAIGLKNMIEALSVRDRSFKIFSPIKTNYINIMISNYPLYNFKRGFVGRFGAPMSLQLNTKQVDISKEAILLSGPLDENLKLGLIEDIQFGDYNFQLDRDKNRKKLYICQMILKEEKTLSILKNMMQLRESYISYFKLPQKKNKEGIYEGNMIYEILVPDGLIKFEIFREKLTISARSNIMLNSNKHIIFSELSKLRLDRYMVSDGLRMTHTGVQEISGRPGYRCEVRDTFRLYEVSVDKIKLKLNISPKGEMLISNELEQDDRSKVARFNINRTYIQAPVSYESQNPIIDKWLWDKPYTSSELKSILDDEDLFDWAKKLFKFVMDIKFKPEFSLQQVEELKAEMTDMELNEAYNIDLDLKAVEEFEQAAFYTGMDEILDSTDILLDQSIELQLPYVDYGEFDYVVAESYIRIHSKCFDGIVDNLAFLDFKTLYTSQFKLDIATRSEWFDLFKRLVDYDSRPQLERISPEIEETVEDLGNDFIFVSSGERSNEVLTTINRTLKMDEKFQIGLSNLPDGIYMRKGQDKPVRIRFKDFRKGFMMNKVLDILLDSLGISKEKAQNEQIDEIFNRKTGEFSSKLNTEEQLRTKVKKYWSRFSRSRLLGQKVEEHFAPDIEEFFIDNPLHSQHQ